MVLSPHHQQQSPDVRTSGLVLSELESNLHSIYGNSGLIGRICLLSFIFTEFVSQRLNKGTTFPDSMYNC